MKNNGQNIMKNNEVKNKKSFIGTVLKKSGDKSIVVIIERKFKHPEYSKFVLRSKKYHAHDESNEFKAGDVVSIIEAKPISKLKRWVAIKN